VGEPKVSLNKKCQAGALDLQEWHDGHFDTIPTEFTLVTNLSGWLSDA
jgi:hypothetical protein